jgi:NAD(P)-dependent dehydrogenase (short-subunit alcohol dehydrogenase family)
MADSHRAGERRIAMVTGASYGIGAATAIALAQDGCNLVLTELPGLDVAETRRRIEALGRRALPVTLDVRSQESIDAAVAVTLDHFGRLDVLVNNAGVMAAGPAVDMPRDKWSAVFDVNVTGTFFMSQRVGRAWIERKQPGVIVSVASVHGIIGVPNVVAYGTSKAAVGQITRMLAIEWAEHGIRVNAVAPGRVLTESPARAHLTRDPKHVAKHVQATPLHRLATPEEVAAAIAYLASPRAATVTGHVLVVDGGLTVA